MPPASARWQGSVRRSPSGVIRSARSPTSAGVTGSRARPGMARQRGGDHRRAFLGLERADAIDQRSARLDQGQRGVEKAPLRACQPGHLLRRLDPGRVRMAPDGARRRTGRIQKHGIEQRTARRRPGQDIAGHRLGRQAGASKVLAHPPKTPVGAVQRHHLGAGRRQLQRLAAGAAHRSATRMPRTPRARAAPATRRRRPAPTRRPRRSPAGQRPRRGRRAGEAFRWAERWPPGGPPRTPLRPDRGSSGPAAPDGRARRRWRAPVSP